MNYYERTFEKLCLEQEKSQALNEMAKIFLFKNTKLSLPKNLNKTDLFFQSNFIQTLTKSHLQNNDWQWTLSQYFRFGRIDDNLLSFFLDLDEENTIFAIRLSGIINDLEHSSWQNIKHYQENYTKLNDFVKVVEYLNNKYQEIKNKYLEIKKKWQWTHIETIIFSSLYMYEIILTQYGNNTINIPYQIDNTPIKNEYIFNAINDLIISSYKSRKSLNDKTLGLLLKDKLYPFIYGEKLTEFKILEYEDFKLLMAFKIEMYLFNDFVFNTFSYQRHTEYKLENSKLIHHSNKQDYDHYAEKFSILQLYWKFRSIKHINKDLENDIKFLLLDRGENFFGNLESYLTTHSAIMLLKEIYGVEKININGNDYDIFDTLFAVNMQQGFYQNHFVNVFFNLINKEKLHPFQALGIMSMQGFLEMENRLPFTFGNKLEKSRRMSDWITDINASKKSKVRKMSDILDFWTINLNNHKNEESYIEKPFYQLDDFIIAFPQQTIHYNVYGSIVNHLRRLHKNRETLKDETSTIEKSLADLFLGYNFKVFCQYLPDDNSIGEIDLIASDHNTILVIELKSTYLKTNLKEAYHYQNFTLKKASYQLNKKLKYVKGNYEKFTNKPFNKIKFYSWIVDTTLEADHEYFNQHLKISLEELIIYLKGHQDFMDFMKNNQEKLNDCHEELLFKDNKIINNLQDLIEKIESNTFWVTALQKYHTIMENAMM